MGSWPAAAEADPATNFRPQALLYYANETSAQVARSGNYASLLQILRDSPNPLGAQLARSVEFDARRFPAIIERDTAALADAARRLRFDLFIFTNADAHAGRFRLLRAETGEFEWRPLAVPTDPSDPVLSASPLARPEVLRAALAQAAQAYPVGPPDMVLIVNSHGDPGHPLMPRVSADVTTAASAAAFARALDGGPDPAGAAWAAPKGVAKAEFWRVLGEASADDGLRFPLVFLESCQSGPAAWRDRIAVPSSVRAVAHSGMADLNMADFEFASIFAPVRPGEDWVALLAAALEDRGVHVDGHAMLWLRLVWTKLAALPTTLYFAPLALWLAWFGLQAIWVRRPERRRIAQP